MKASQWTQRPLEVVSFYALRYSEEALVLELRGRTRYYSFLFPSPIAVRSMGESSCSSICGDARNGSGQFWRVDESGWLAQLRAESAVLERVEMDHYLFVTDDQCVDVASMEPPRVSSGPIDDLSECLPVRRDALLELFALQFTREIGVHLDVTTGCSVSAARQQLAGLWRGMFLGFGVLPLGQSFDDILKSVVTTPVDELGWVDFKRALNRIAARIAPSSLGETPNDSN